MSATRWSSQVKNSRGNPAIPQTRKDRLPIPRVLHRFHLPLANHEFLPTVQDEQPAMAAQRNHLFNAIKIDERAPMDSRETHRRELELEFSQRFRGQITLLRGNDPHQLSLCLKGDNLPDVDWKDLASNPAKDFARH